MLKHLNILTAYSIIAVALTFKLGLTAPVLLFILQPALLIAAYWRKLPELSSKGLHKLILTFFICLHGFRLFEYAYDIVIHNEAIFKPSTFHNMVFAVAFAASFVPEKYLEEDQVES